MAWQTYLSNYMRKQQEADQWRGFQNRFMELAREEQGRAEVITKAKLLQTLDRVLRVSCNYQKHPEGWERGKSEQGLICLLDTPPHGVWNYANDGVSENFFERVRLCVVEAGRTLTEYPKGTDPEDFWLHRLYLDLLRNNSDLLFCAGKEGGMILSVCVASATFCARLERQTLADAENGAKTGIVASLAETENLDPPGTTERFHRQVKAAKLAVALGDSAILESLRADENQADSSPAQNNGKTAQRAESAPADKTTVIGRNINRLRKECGWSLDDLSLETGIDKKLILSHVNKGARPRPRILREYAQAFSKKLGRNITAPDLEVAGQ